jgi:hypothetical protein
VVSANEEDIVRVEKLQTEQPRNALNGIGTPIDIISQEKISGFRRRPGKQSYVDEITELAVNIANENERRINSE